MKKKLNIQPKRFTAVKGVHNLLFIPTACSYNKMIVNTIKPKKLGNTKLWKNSLKHKVIIILNLYTLLL